MKIEKINDNQIRCTLTRQDLAERELSELAYGTEKAKLLFRDMMQQAAYEFGFEANDIPLMIEAIPLSSDSVILIVTKVEDPEELDTRFAKFSPSSNDNSSTITPPAPAPLDGADDILNLFHQYSDKVVTQEMDNGEFDILIRFEDKPDDPYYYCFKDEGCHIIYHRFLPEDYADFGF